MRFGVDTNVLVRLITRDDEAQARTAVSTLEAAERVALSALTLSELAWVLDRRYDFGRADISAAIRRLIDLPNVSANRPAVEAGLAVLDAGGDFADEVIAFDARWLGGDTFVSFDQKAVKLLETQGIATLLLA